MLYFTVSFYHKDYWFNYIRNQGDDGQTHRYLFDVLPNQSRGKFYLSVNQFDTRMYPFGIKTEKVLTYYRLLKWKEAENKYEQINDKYGSDWIGF